ncbi:hypothetical protein D9X30_1081 [Cupriavidus sp. U2]|nr:hypothetical protein D9X30_1081 [Cupriavidus sp. U2]
MRDHIHPKESALLSAPIVRERLSGCRLALHNLMRNLARDGDMGLIGGFQTPGPQRAAGKKKARRGAALSNGLTDTGSVLQVEETASLALYARTPLNTIETF